MKNVDQQPDLIRRAYYAGSFYPADPVELSEQVRGFIQAESGKVSAEIVGLIAPHAGYIYSGSCAAAAYRLLKGTKYEIVVVIAPSHQAFFTNTAVFRGGGYQTPLGVIYTDPELAATIANIHPKVVFADDGHSGGARPEHSLEVQLPFLQMVLGDLKMVPVVMGSQEYDMAIALGEVLASALTGKKALIVASSDLSHYHSAAQADKMDKGISEAVRRFDWKLLHDRVNSGYSEACGAGPMISCMYAAKRLGATQAQIVRYTHSGMVTGDDREVVGYLSAICHR
ncbi:MAG: AmmeMemoRadiSam system protein B [candidate division Zixibacteria bacterium]|nr:AmmeMemoRadiSam system protein B [candidate division Zixibacteria bacterium]